MKNKRIIGLTGGIATGKTTVANYLESSLKLPIFDADIYAREAVELGSDILAKIRDRYGGEILLSDGTLNRKQLGEIVFDRRDERQWLEQQIHPYVRDRFLAAREQMPENSTGVFVIPLLFEANMTDLVTEIWVVFCPPEQQIQRLMERDRLTEDQANARIQSQMRLSEKCDRADIILDNSATSEHLIQQIDAALRDRGDNER